MKNPLNNATLIWDWATPFPSIPSELYPTNPEIGDAAAEYEWAIQQIGKAGQFQGTAIERLCEIAGRACYDSFGKGRNSADYHKHLIEVNHGSVWEHAVVTIHLLFRLHDAPKVMLACLNRPGTWVEPLEDGARVTLNIRAVREWDAFSRTDFAKNIGNLVKHLVHPFAPCLVADTTYEDHSELSGALVAPDHEEEKWVTMLLTGSRGFSHELVRHKYRTAVSQRSTRYVDESESQWVHHPLILDHFTKEVVHRASNGEATELSLEQKVRHTLREARDVYREAVLRLEKGLVERGVDKFTARKQARGAARGYLGNALYTEVVFSASVAQWKRMLKQRASAAADAEIRDVFCDALAVLKRSRYADDFSSFDLVPSADGLGYHLAEKES